MKNLRLREKGRQNLRREEKGLRVWKFLSENENWSGAFSLKEQVTTRGRYPPA